MRTKAISILGEWQVRLKKRLAKYVPLFWSTKRLTFLTLFFAIAVFVSYYLANRHIGFIWLASFFIFAFWITDNLDGEVGRYRKEGFVKWGLYADHFFDFVYFTAVLFGLYMVVNEPNFLKYFITIYVLGSAFFIHCYLSAVATGRFIVSELMISGTELVFLMIGFNTMIFFLGKKILTLFWFYVAVIVVLFIILLFAFIKTQNLLSKLDMEIKKKNKKNSRKKSK